MTAADKTTGIQHQAIGWLWGVYQPDPADARRGTLQLTTGQSLPAVIKVKTLAKLKQRVEGDFSASPPLLWTVYPRTFPQLRVTLARFRPLDAPPAEDALNRFQLCGLLTYRYEDAAILEVRFNEQSRYKRKTLRSGYAGFTLKVQGTVPESPLNHPWQMAAKLGEDALQVVEAHPVEGASASVAKATLKADSES